MHLLNMTYVVLVTLRVIVPGLLSSFFGLGIFVAKASAPNAMIYRGDIMISKVMPIFELSTNDVFLRRNPNTWNLSIYAVASKSMRADMTTISTMSGGRSDQMETATLNSLTPTHKVITVIPKLGYWLMAFMSILVKSAVGIGLIGMNLFVYWRRARKQKGYLE
jgi:UPF0716 family protein affecting phage T7 exclusion